MEPTIINEWTQMNGEQHACTAIESNVIIRRCPEPIKQIAIACFLLRPMQLNE
jgi:hypothetical protein